MFTALAFTLVHAWAAGTPGCEENLTKSYPRFRDALVRARFFSEPEGRAARIKRVTIDGARRRGVRGLVPMLNRRAALDGLLVIDSRGRPLVFEMGDQFSGHVLFDPAENPDASVWDEDERLLRVVRRAWRWERTRPAAHEISDLTLTQFVDEFERPLAELLRDGHLTEDEVLAGVIQEARHADARYAVLEASGKVFVFTRGDTPAWANDFVRGLSLGEAVEVGASRRRLFQRFDPTTLQATGEAGWAPPAGALALNLRAEDLDLRRMVEANPGSLDQLAVLPDPPSVDLLAHAALVSGEREDTGRPVSVVLATESNPLRAWVWDVTAGRWDPGARGVLRLRDGRRLGIQADGPGFRWLGHRDAIQRLREAVKNRRTGP